MDIVFPFRGINKGSLKGGQPQGTAYDIKNMMPKDSIDGRIRGGQRAGLVDFSRIGEEYGQEILGFDSKKAIFSNNGMRFNLDDANSHFSAGNYIKIMSANNKYIFDIKGSSVAHIKLITDGYNVDPTGETDSKAGLQKAIDDAFSTAIPSQEIDGLCIVNAIIDLEGGSYKIQSGLTLKTGAVVKLADGSIFAGDDFTDECMITNTGKKEDEDLPSVYCKLINHTILFDNISIFCRHKTSGIKLIGATGFYFQNSRCVGFTEYGIDVWGDSGIHEFFCINSQINQYWWDEVFDSDGKQRDGVSLTATGIICGVYDSHIIGSLVFLCDIGIAIRRHSVFLSQSHPWGCRELVVVEPEKHICESVSNVIFDGVYFDAGGGGADDGEALVIKGNTSGVIVNTCTFLQVPNRPGFTNTNYKHIKIKDFIVAGIPTLAGNSAINNSLIINNMFKGSIDESVDGNGNFTNLDESIYIDPAKNFNGSTGNTFKDNKFEKCNAFFTECSLDKTVYNNPYIVVDKVLPDGLIKFGDVSCDVEHNAYYRGSEANIDPSINVEELISTKQHVRMIGDVALTYTNNGLHSDGDYIISAMNTEVDTVRSLTGNGLEEVTLKGGEAISLIATISNNGTEMTLAVANSMVPKTLNVLGFRYAGSAALAEVVAMDDDGNPIDGEFRFNIKYV